jgi:signal transduction histidine kinase
VLQKFFNIFSIRRWKAQTRAAEQRALLKATPGLVFGLNQNGIFHSHLGGNAEAKISTKDLLGKKLRNLVPSASAAAVTKYLENVFLLGKPTVLLCEMTIASSSYLVEVRIAPSYSGNAVAVIRELTDHTQLEEELRLARRTEIAGKLAIGLAHDFNNLLMVIDGYCHLLQASIPADNPSHSQVRAIGRAAARAGSLTQQLLNFGQKTKILPQVVDLNQVISDADKLLGLVAGEQLKLRTRFAPDLRLVRIDKSEIERILMNLVINARDAMPQGGEILIETSNGRLDKNYALQHGDVIPGEYVMLAVHDSGEGIDEENLSHIFEPFFTTKGHKRGVGLGLSTISSIVTQNNGHIAVESKLGSGTTFKIYLPLMEEQNLQEFSQNLEDGVPDQEQHKHSFLTTCAT